MGFYARYILPTFLDLAMRQPPIMRQRAKVVPRAAGRVLEVGIGSGLNISFYDQAKIEKVWGLDPSLELQKMARRRAAECGLNIEYVGLSGEEIPIDDAFFDSIVITYTLCTIPDAPRALREMRRVLKPGGQMCFVEHGLAPDQSIARWQHRLNTVWPAIAGGCNMNRPIPDLIRQAGFEINGLETMYLPGPKPLTYNYWGTATRSA
jgi:ubiquinone/menaquinone biosynthesis C-methylase UbiE